MSIIDRLAKAGRDTAVEEVTHDTCPHCSAILVLVKTRGRSDREHCQACGGRVVKPGPVRMVFDQWPLKRLHARGHITHVEFEAGRRYYEHWYHSGLSPIGAVDLGKVGQGSEPKPGMAVSERQAYHRRAYRQGVAALDEFRVYVDGIVLREEDPEVVGKRFTGRTQTQQSRAIAIEMLKLGLKRLAKAYELEPRGN